MRRGSIRSGSALRSDQEKGVDDLNIKWVFMAIVIAVVAAGMLRSPKAAAQESADGKTLAQLAKAGSDLTKPHAIDFFFYFPTKDEAEKVTPKLQALGLSTKVGHAAKGSTWLIQGNKVMIPTDPNCRAFGERLTRLPNLRMENTTGGEPKSSNDSQSCDRPR
jgi:hypothetical protein